MVEEIERDNSGDISIHLAAPEMIRSWSHGEVTKPETINYRSFKPEITRVSFATVAAWK